MRRGIWAVAAALAGLLGSIPAFAQQIHCDYSGLPIGDSVSRVDASLTLDGELRTLHFASLYNFVSWLQESIETETSLPDPPRLTLIDFGKGEASRIELALDEWDPEGAAIGSFGHVGPWQHYGPWFVETENGPDGAYWPYFIAFSDPLAAVEAAADWHGQVWHWDSALDRLVTRWRQMNAPSGGGAQPATAPTQGAYPYILPGGEDDLK